MKCKNCKNEISYNDVFCTFCGERLNDSVTLEQPISVETLPSNTLKIKRNYIKRIVIIVAIFLTAVLGLIGSQEYTHYIENQKYLNALSLITNNKFSEARNALMELTDTRGNRDILLAYNEALEKYNCNSGREKFSEPLDLLNKISENYTDNWSVEIFEFKKMLV